MQTTTKQTMAVATLCLIVATALGIGVSGLYVGAFFERSFILFGQANLQPQANDYTGVTTWAKTAKPQDVIRRATEITAHDPSLVAGIVSLVMLQEIAADQIPDAYRIEMARTFVSRGIKAGIRFKTMNTLTPFPTHAWVDVQHLQDDLTKIETVRTVAELDAAAADATKHMANVPMKGFIELSAQFATPPTPKG